MRNLTEIIVHCTATPNSWRDGESTSSKVAEVKRWHTDPKPGGRGWSDIGYHFLIDRDGTIAEGRPMTRDGAHVLGKNKGTVGISIFGGQTSSADQKFNDNYTPEQDRALRWLIADLKEKYPSIEKLSGHNEYANKACPGFNVREWYRAPASGFFAQQDPAPIHSPQPAPRVSPIPPEVLDLIEDAGGVGSWTKRLNAVLQWAGSFGITGAGAFAFVGNMDWRMMAVMGAIGVAVFGIASYTIASRNRKASKAESARIAVIKALNP